MESSFAPEVQLNFKLPKLVVEAEFSDYLGR